MPIPDVHLRPLLDEDVLLVESWVRSPHVRRWILDQEGVLSDLHDAGRRYAQRVIVLDGEPVGYLQAEVVDPVEWTAVGLSVPEGAIDIDILIGSEEDCGKGIGSGAIAEVVEELGARVYVATTSISNIASRRAFVKNGFTVQQEFDEPGAGRMVLMVRQPR